MLGRRAVPAVLALAILPVSAYAQAGYEVLVPDTTSGSPSAASVAAAADGSFVVVWQGTDGSNLGIFARRFDASGSPLGGEFRVNAATAGNQFSPRVASSPDGSFVVVWTASDGSSYGAFGQRYDAFGAPQGGEFPVNAYTTNEQRAPAVAMADTGAFVVVWQSYGNKAGGVGRATFGQRYDAAGDPQGSEFQVSTFTTGDQTSPAVAYDPAGNFVVAWDSRYASQDGSASSVHGRRYDSAGVAQGGEFLVNLYTTANQLSPMVATDAQGNFVVVWESALRDGSGYGIASRRFDAAGSGGDEFAVNAYTTAHQRIPTIAHTADGGFVVAWSSGAQDGSGYGIFGRRLAASGAATGDEFRVTVTTAGNQTRPAIASGGEGFVVTWQSPDGSGDGIFARTGPEVSVADSTDVPEGGGSAAFVVTLSAPVEWTVAVDYTTADGTATGSDYVAASGALMFAPGVVSQTVTVAAKDEPVREDDEVFHLDLSNPVLARIVDARGDALLLDDDPLPALAIRDVTVREGNTGSRGVTLVVALSSPSAQTVLADYATAAGSATAGTDYATTAGTLTFPPFSREQRLTVTISGDTSPEPNETFFVNLSGEMNAALADGQARVTISDDDRRSPFFRGKKGSKSGSPRR